MSRKAIKWAALGGLVCGAAAWATAVWAVPSNGYWRMYYSDATYTQLVGEEILFCSGLHELDGYRTPYKIVVDEWTCNGEGEDGGL